jgi:asparaginyl-tRNA synthetase
MEKHVWIRDIADRAGQVARVRGWVYHLRTMKKLAFIVVRDGTGLLQVVVARQDVGDELFDQVCGLGQEAAVEVRGPVRVDERAPGGHEMQLESLELIGESRDYPITPKEHGTTFLMDHRHLWLRSRKQHALMKVRHTVAKGIRDFLDGEGFTLVDAPIFTPNACEGTSTLFETDYFGDRAYLTQSGQLYMEAAAAAFGKVYCFGPTFRAEKSKTRRHLTEFWMVEPEVAFADLDDIMELEERFVCYLVERALEEHRDLLVEVLERDVSPLEAVKPPFPRVHYDEAVRMLKEGGVDFEWGGDFGSPDETFLAARYDRPFFVHRFPASIKAFYMEKDPTDPRYSLSVDLLAPEGYGEIIGGGQRSADLDYLLSQIRTHELPQEAFEWYLDLRRYGTFPHAGFGLGLERMVTWIAGIPHLREAIPFPRQIHRLAP